MSRIKLSDHFTYTRLFKFVLPSIAMMVFTSIYGIVDGLFVSNFVGKTAFAAVNISMPYLMMISAIGFMIGTGGSALVGILLGEKESELAKQSFTMLILLLFVAAVIVSILSAIFMPQISVALGADEGALLANTILYGRISLISMPMYMLQNAFQSFLVTAEKPKLGLVVMILAGVTNMVLDFVFIALFHWGIAGAGFATVTSEYVGALIPLVYFARKNDSLLRFVRFKMNWRHVWHACTNGASELMSNIAGSVLSIAYNIQLMRLAGENGVAAYGVVMYVSFIFGAMFFGYMIGSAPLFSYNFGADNHEELRNLYDKSLKICWIAGAVMFVMSFALAPAMSRTFVGYDPELLAMTIEAMRTMVITFVFMGFCVFGSSFFTALGNGLISAIIPFMRTIVFQLTAVMLMPIPFGVDGIWWSSPVSSMCTAVLVASLLRKHRDRYHLRKEAV